VQVSVSTSINDFHAEKCKNEILKKFIDFSSIKNSIYPRYFEHLKKGLLVGTGWEIVKNIINLKLEGNFYIFIDGATAIYKIIHWDNVRKIIYEWGSFDMYIVSESYDFMICLTNENNVIIYICAGIIVEDYGEQTFYIRSCYIR